jgi:hypothetical protein
MKLRLFLFFTFVFLAVTSREPPWADAHVTYDTTQALVDRWSFDVHTEGGPPWLYSVHAGHKYGVFPLGNVVAMIPSYLAYKLVHAVAPSLPDRPVFALASHLSSSLLMAAACVLLFHLLLRRRVTLRWALFATFAFGLCTMAFIYARAPYSEALQTVLVLWLIERTLAQAEAPTAAGLAWLGVAAGVLINSKLVYVLLLPVVATYLIVIRRRAHELPALFRRLPLAIVAFLELVFVALWHNQIKTGSWTDSGYQIKEGIFSGDLLAGLYGLLLSSGKSLFLYSPPLVLGVLGVATAWRRRRAETAFLVAIFTICTLFNAKFRHWHADYCWGPRHLMAVTPILILMAFPWLPEAMLRGRVRARQIALGLVLGAGLTVQILGATFYWDHYIRILIAVKDQTGAPGWFQENLSHGHYIPSFSPLRGQAWLLRHFVRQDPDLDRDAPWKSVIPQPADLTDGWRRLRVDWWALDWIDEKTLKPVWSGWAFLLLISAGALVSGLGLLDRSRRPDELEQPEVVL